MLIRVTMLAPVVLIISIVIRNRISGDGQSGQRPLIVPFFVLAYLGFATLNSMCVIPALATDLMGGLSRWALLISVAVVGMK